MAPRPRRARLAVAAAAAAAAALVAVASAEGGEAPGGEALGEHVCRGWDEEWRDCPDLAPCGRCEPVDCAFDDWGDWYMEGGCTGLRFRHRKIKVQNNECGEPCNGPKIMSEAHLLDRCQVEETDCKFSAWAQWTACSTASDQSIRSRAVETPPSAGGKACAGGVKETKACGVGPKPRDCEFTDWQEWTTCSATCGEGRHTRMRRIAVEARHSGDTCQDTVLETKKCQMEECPTEDCTVSEWHEWSVCGQGHTQRYRYRKISTPPLNGGMPCPSDLAQTDACPLPQALDCELTAWTAWSQCDKSCMGGQTYRERKLARANSDGGVCEAAALKETATCNTGPCGLSAKNDCQLSAWSTWSPCSAPCGPGSTTRTRKVEALASDDGKACEGPLEEIVACEDRRCDVVDCQWSEWDAWSACSCSCGGGSKHRSRAVAVAPRNGGNLCEPGDKSQVSPCNTQTCDAGCVDGVWGQWMEWSQCSATCSGGFRTRRRDVEVQPDACGLPVSGVREEFAVCSELPPCVADVDCELSEWGEWSHCSCHCFGIRERNRFIKAFASGAGKSCAEDALKVIQPCNPLPGMPVSRDCGNRTKTDCELDVWGSWSPCNVPCGGGQMERRRQVLKNPQNEGKPCEDALVITVPCNTQPCQPLDCQDCQWGMWSEWGDCSKCGGQRFRHRSIEKLPNHCGKPCEAKSAKEVSNCTSECQKTAYCEWTEWSQSTACNAGCGSGTSMRNRVMRLSEERPSKSFIFQGAPDSKCAGTQLNVSACPVVESCQPKCEPRPCKFAPWGEWQEPTCVGLCERQRAIEVTNNECGEPCSGPLLETRRCEAACEQPVDCELSSWREWSHCPASGAGSSQRFRSREVVRPPQFGGDPCTGPLHETAPCEIEEPEPCKFSSWGAWSACSRSCGAGWRKRSRNLLQLARLGGGQCDGDLEMMDHCYGEDPMCFNHSSVNCEFGEWGAWSDCGFDGQRFRERSIAQLSERGGKLCKGAMHETETCKKKAVDCLVSEWTQWDECDRDCGGGQTHRQRQVHHFPENGGKTCPHELVQTKGCNTQPCNNGDCHVSVWQEWGECSSTCGVGLQTRSRDVVSLRSAGGIGCDMSLSETMQCPDSIPCGVDCEWEDWTQWGGCSCSCGGGQRTRDRHIRKSPRDGGKPCEVSEKEQVEPCSTQECKPAHCVDGEFGEWEPWSKCTATCGGGTSGRTRRIVRTANECGEEPQGKNSEVRFCNVEVACEAPVDCVLTEWETWSDCSASCNGITRRSRRIGTYGRGEGKWCAGALKETWPCNPGPHEAAPAGCGSGEAIDCLFADWEEWGECTTSCGGGQHARSRVVAQHPAFGGKPCQGALSELRECARVECKGPPSVDCEYGDWSDWGACTKCSGQMLRTRRIKRYPENGGQPCEAIRTEETAECPRKCHEKLYCTWGEWESWARCTATCGTGGKRHRRRYLHLSGSSDDKPPAPVEDMIDEYDSLYRHTVQLEENHIKELFLSFGAGCASLVVGLVAARAVSFLRGRSALRCEPGQSGVSSRALSRRRNGAGLYRQLQSAELPGAGASLSGGGLGPELE